MGWSGLLAVHNHKLYIARVLRAGVSKTRTENDRWCSVFSLQSKQISAHGLDWSCSTD